MKTNALLKLHQRQVDILDMIIKCNNYTNDHAPKLKKYQASKDWYIGIWTRHELIKFHSGIVNKYTAIKERLIRYYKDIQIRIMTMQPEIELPEREGNLLTNQFLS